MKSYFFRLTTVLVTFLGFAINIAADDEPVLIGVSDIKPGVKIYIECGPTDYHGLYMVAHPENASQNAVMCNEALADVGTAAQWVFESAGGYDFIYTDKPLYYLKDVTTGKYYGAASSTSSINQADKRMVEGTTLAYTFCLLTADEIKNKESHNVSNYSNTQAVYIHHSNSDGTWFRLSRFGGYTQVYYISSSVYPTNADWYAWNVYAAEEPNSIKAAVGIAALQEYYDEVNGYYAIMTDATYDDSAFTAAQKTALADALANAKAALDDTPSGEDSYYTNLKDQLQAVYEQVPYVEGGKKYWAIKATDLTDGSIAMFESAPGTNGAAKLMVANTAASGINAVLCQEMEKGPSAIWQLEATGGYDAIYTSKPTYYLKDVTSGKYFGSSDFSSLSENAKVMVDSKSDAYPFAFLTIGDIQDKQGITINGYGNDDAVIIHHSIDATQWIRPCRFGAYGYVFYINSTNYPTNTMWPAWNVYTGEKNYSVQDELAQALADYGSMTFTNVGTDPGCYEEGAVSSYNDALASAQAMTSSNTRQEIRNAIDNLKTEYAKVTSMEVLPVTGDYYYIESAWSSKAGLNTRVYDPQDDAGKVAYNNFTADDKYAIWRVTETAEGQYTIQNYGSGRYVGQQYNNYVSLVDAAPTETYQIFTYNAEGQFKWRDNSATFTYYINTGSYIGRYYNQSGTSTFDAWYLKRVPASVVAALTDGYDVNDGVITVDANVDMTLLESLIDAQTTITAVDLRTATLPTATTAEQLSALVDATNALVYLADDASISGTNIVSNGVCADLQLADKTDFKALSGFTATQGTMTRKLYPGLNTVCLPFGFAATDLPLSGANLYTFGGVDDTSITFNQVESVNAGVPCLVELPAATETKEYSFTFNAKDVVAAPEAAAGICGSFTNKALGEGYYKLSTDDEFVKTTAISTISAFRFYLDLSGYSSSNTYSLNLNSDDITALSSVEGGNGASEIVAVYDANGVRRAMLQTGLNIVRFGNGQIKKIIVK